MNPKLLWSKILETDAIIWITYAFAVLLIGGLAWMLQGCALVDALTGTASTVDNTVQAIDQDGSGSISMEEIIMWIIGYDMLKGTGVAGAKKGIARFRNGRKSDDTTCSTGSGS